MRIFSNMLACILLLLNCICLIFHKFFLDGFFLTTYYHPKISEICKHVWNRLSRKKTLAATILNAALMSSPINLPFINPVSSLFINLSKTVFIRSHFQMLTYKKTFKRFIRRQFFRNCFGLPSFGIQVITPSLLILKTDLINKID